MVSHGAFYRNFECHQIYVNEQITSRGEAILNMLLSLGKFMCKILSNRYLIYYYYVSLHNFYTKMLAVTLFFANFVDGKSKNN